MSTQTQTITGFDGKEIKPGIFVIGDIHYYPTPYKEETNQLYLPYICGSWRCLANVYGCLCVIELKVDEKKGE
jgi:hypothetical protein